MSMQSQLNGDDSKPIRTLANNNAYVSKIQAEKNGDIIKPQQEQVSSTIKQIQREALNKAPQPKPLNSPNKFETYDHELQSQKPMINHSILRETPAQGIALRSSLRGKHDNNSKSDVKSYGRPHRIAFEDYNNEIIRGDITNSEHHVPGKLPIALSPDNKYEAERDAIKKLREKAKELPPPVEKALFLKPNARKKQVNLHFKPVLPVEKPVQQLAPNYPTKPNPTQPTGHWVYHSDVVRESNNEVHVKAEHLQGNLYAKRIAAAPNELNAEAAPMEVSKKFDQENVNPKQTIAKPKQKPAVQYEVKPWMLTIRKELFNPYEQLDDIHEIDLLFSQIITDCRKPNRYRIRQYERDEINKILRDNAVPPDDLDHPKRMPVEIKINVIEAARRWPLYFSRFYNVIEERNNEYVNRLLGISESGVRLIARNLSNADEPLFISDHFEYCDIAELVIDETREHLQIVSRKGLIITVRSDQAEQIQHIIERFITGAGKSKIFVRATADYITKEPNLLSFKKDDIIQIITRNNQRNDSDGEWLFGKIDNRYGNLPASYVEPFEPQAVSLLLRAVF
uniref:SH3 domain-containing protein n=1 Tax=Syphacia muris TaxID=451379 RepID=A0A0N5AY31_9BILA